MSHNKRDEARRSSHYNTRDEARREKIRLISQCIDEHEPIGVNEISRKTTINNATVSRICLDLVAAGRIDQLPDRRYTTKYYNDMDEAILRHLKQEMGRRMPLNQTELYEETARVAGKPPEDPEFRKAYYRNYARASNT